MPVRRGTCPTAGKQIEKKPMLHNVTQVCFRTSKEILGVPRGIRTPDLLVRSQSLYPAELWAHFLLRTYDVVLTTIAIISHLLQLVKRFFEFFSGFSKKVCIARNFGVFLFKGVTERANAVHLLPSKNGLDKPAKIAYNKSKESTPVDGLLPLLRLKRNNRHSLDAWGGYFFFFL